MFVRTPFISHQPPASASDHRFLFCSDFILLLFITVFFYTWFTCSVVLVPRRCRMFVRMLCRVPALLLEGAVQGEIWETNEPVRNNSRSCSDRWPIITCSHLIKHVLLPNILLFKRFSSFDQGHSIFYSTHRNIWVLSAAASLKSFSVRRNKSVSAARKCILSSPLKEIYINLCCETWEVWRRFTEVMKQTRLLENSWTFGLVLYWRASFNFKNI